MNMKNQNQLSSVLDVTENPQGSLLIGKIVSISDVGNPMIAFDEHTRNIPVEALTTIMIEEANIGQDVAISFAQNQSGMPIVMGIIRRVLDEVITQQTEQSAAQEDIVKPEVIVDGNKLELSAPEEVTIRCGKASITLNKNGKIMIKGEHMLNRISGSYQIKSGSIQLN